MLRDPHPAVVARNLQAALLRCGIAVDEEAFAYAAGNAMANLLRSALFGLRQVLAERVAAGASPESLLADIDALLATQSDKDYWPNATIIPVRVAASAAPHPEGRSFCARFGWGRDFPPGRGTSTRDAVALAPPCFHGTEAGGGRCDGRQPAGTGYAVDAHFLRPGWRPARASHGLLHRAATTSAASASADPVPASSAANAADIASASEMSDEGAGPRRAVATSGDSETSAVESFDQ